jgi:hypothetical protein
VSASPPLPSRGRLLAAAVLLAAVIGTLYGPSLGFEATTVDDEALIFRNPVQQNFGLEQAVESFDPTASRLAYGLQYTPLTDISYVLDRALFGDDAGPYHLQSIVLHVAATWALGLLALALGATPLVALATATVFAVHPLQVESVAWISGRDVPLAGFLTLGCLLAWCGARRRESAELDWLAFLATVAANLAKQSAVTIAALLLVVELVGRASGRWPGRRSAWIAWSGHALVCTVFVYLGLEVGAREGIVGGGHAEGAFQQTLLTLSAYGWYAMKFLWPSGLLPAYTFATPTSFAEPLVLLGVALLAGGSVLALATLRRAPLVAAGFALAVLSLLPGVHGLGTQVTADRYAYLAVAGLALAAGEWLRGRPQWAVGPVVLVAALAWTGGSVARVGDWTSDRTLYADAIAKEPANPLWHHLYGRALIDAGQEEAGREAMNVARGLTGGEEVQGYCPLPDVLAAYGNERMEAGDGSGAENALRQALDAARPGEFDDAAHALASFLMKSGRWAEAYETYRTAVERDPEGTPESRDRMEMLRDHAAPLIVTDSDREPKD